MMQYFPRKTGKEQGNKIDSLRLKPISQARAFFPKLI